jgi:hypothetical protein
MASSDDEAAVPERAPTAAPARARRRRTRNVRRAQQRAAAAEKAAAAQPATAATAREEREMEEQRRQVAKASKPQMGEGATKHPVTESSAFHYSPAVGGGGASELHNLIRTMFEQIEDGKERCKAMLRDGQAQRARLERLAQQNQRLGESYRAGIQRIDALLSISSGMLARNRERTEARHARAVSQRS